MITKTCNACRVEYPKTAEFFFYKNKKKNYFQPYCKDCFSADKKKHYQENKEKITARQQKYYQNNRGVICEKTRMHASKPEVKKRRNERERQRRREDPVYKIQHYVRVAINRGLRESDGVKTCSIWEVLPYTPKEFRTHMETHDEWEDWMKWENWGLGDGCWNIDHIIPQSLLPFDTLDHPNFLKCWGLENLRPLDAIENIKKGNKVDSQMLT